LATPRFPRVIVDVPESEADVASFELFELGATGLEVRDGTTLERGKAGCQTLVASFEHDAQASSALESLPEAWSPRLSAIVGDAWRDEYKKYFHPFLLCRGLVVRPPWEPYAPKEGELVLTLEPGRAFGTGLHETTSLVAEVLAERAGELSGKGVLDVGTGSGILALTALLLGAGEARAIDVDADAVSVAKENGAANDLCERLVADDTPLGDLSGRYAVVLANIEAGVLGELAPALAQRAAPGALVVLSGILAPPASGQVPALLEVYSDFVHLETKTKGEWAALVLRAPP
jgi:ribosomal protein L11 methyltransferase